MKAEELMAVLAEVQPDTPYHKEHAMLLDNSVMIEIVDATTKGEKTTIEITTRFVSKEFWIKLGLADEKTAP